MAHLAQHWHADGRKGAGVKVGIIDLRSTATSRDSFKGLRAFMAANGLSAKGYCFTDFGKATSQLTDCDPISGDYDNNHGTLVFESLWEIAPEADFYISNPASWGDLQSAVKWMASQGVKVIVHSVTWAVSGPGDGTSPDSSSPVNTIKWATNQGITWVNAAGNGAQNAWFGAFNDSDADGNHEWASNADETLRLWTPYSTTLAAMLRWDDSWTGASIDLDIDLYEQVNGRYVKVVQARDTQAGQSGDYPTEFLSYQLKPYRNYLLAVSKKTASSAPGWLQWLMWGTGIRLEHWTPHHSVFSPADDPTPGPLAVGATDYADQTAVESYSGRGPSITGAIKPDIVGVDCVEVSTNSDAAFRGTSQATPHVFTLDEQASVTAGLTSAPSGHALHRYGGQGVALQTLDTYLYLRAGADAVFSVTAVPAPKAPLTVTVDIAQTGDYAAAVGARTVTIPANASAVALAVATSTTVLMRLTGRSLPPSRPGRATPCRLRRPPRRCRWQTTTTRRR